MNDDSPVQPHVTIWGAARYVTGSMHLLQSERQKILLDCGLILEKGAQERNRSFPFKPHQLDAVVLTHAHLDHCGNLPSLVKQGFRGPIYTTSATRDLLRPMLMDASHIQNLETSYYNNRREKGDPWLPSLFDEGDIDQTIEMIEPVSYGRRTRIGPDVEMELRDAGHILGSASAHLTMSQGNSSRRLTYTGDLGRSSIPLLCPVSPLLPSDLIISEATYGGMLHETFAEMQAKLCHHVTSTIERGGKVLIPAFSLGRVQLVIYTLMQLIEAGRIEETPIYVDSPLAHQVLAVMQQHTNLLAPSVRETIRKRAGFLHAPYVHYVTSTEESKDVMYDSTPSIIIASSGMGEGGRIIHHIKNSIDDPRCTVILVSFQAPGSLGARLLEPSPTIRISGRDWNKWAEVVVLRGFSGHADQAELLELLQPQVEADARVVLVHGEENNLSALQQVLNAVRAEAASIAERGVSIPV